MKLTSKDSNIYSYRLLHVVILIKLNFWKNFFGLKHTIVVQNNVNYFNEYKNRKKNIQVKLNCKTSNNQRLGSVLDDLDPKLSLLCQVGDDVICACKICEGCQICIPRSIHSLIDPYNLNSSLY